MEKSGLTASDVLALTRDNGSIFNGNGGVMGIFALIIIFILLFGGNGFWGNSGTASQLALSDINMAQYFQTQDNTLRGIAQGQSTAIEQVMRSNYDNALLLKDISNQMSNSVAGISNQIANQTNTIQNMFNNNTIRELSDKLAVTRDELSNTRQTAQITENILGNLATTAPKPPCYYGCGCGTSSLY